MPRIIIHTNLKDADIPEDFEDKAAEKISAVLNYPLELVYITVSTGNRMLNNGRKTAMAFIDIESVDRFSAEVNDDYTKVFLPFFATLLNLPQNRVVLKYFSPRGSDFGVVRQPPEFKSTEHFLQLKK